jgi:hypothetical protein
MMLEGKRVLIVEDDNIIAMASPVRLALLEHRLSGRWGASMQHWTSSPLRIWTV